MVVSIAGPHGRNDPLSDASNDRILRSAPYKAIKTGANRELPPSQTNWWETRCAAILRKVYRNGPVGVTHLSQDFGGKKNYGSKPNRPVAGSRHIIRTALQQLEAAGLVEKVESRFIEGEDGDEDVQLYAGRVVTSSGQSFVDNVAHSIRAQVEEQYPGLSKY
ncbi:MAG: 30S ribosomal protein S19e [Verrucomicrobia bacterium]|nr:30S ribosomal protein S19e [Verrucomicrobiota bacterium]